MEKHEILKIIHSAIIEVSPYAADILEKQENKDTKYFFVDLGINSIDYAQIALILMHKLDIDISIEVFASTNSISDVVKIFYEELGVEV